MSAWIEHAPFASWLIDAARPRSVVELGTHNGFSLFAFAEAARRLGLQTQLTGLDSWEGDDQAGYFDPTVYETVKREAADRFPESVRLIRGYFVDSVDKIRDGSVDLLHIDGRHGYNDVRADFEQYRPKLSERGVVLFHDIAEHGKGFGVHRFWDEVAGQHPSFSFEHGHGLGVLAVGKRAPDSVLRFIEIAGAQGGAVRDAYARLGARIVEYYRGAVEAPATLVHFRNLRAQAEIDARAAMEETSRLRQELARLQASASWRVTGPLRWARGLPRRIR
ncbi:class I SAM-dependent methyltransferase [Diaminobutyricimonas aerilata]|uniref:class I SAM-dependent methyltransferase n=1 Tax=Diaminobutyricimonas aerilata TaxID=1162967 RepID=UPI001FE43025|nr:class I SAM-dependent methyltransferase [Diaminobutyricimonas aerilata]